MRYFENDEFVVPEKYQKMTLEQLDKRCSITEKIYKIILKLRPSTQKDKLDSLGFKVNL